jgi:hypothetical protein
LGNFEIICAEFDLKSFQNFVRAKKTNLKLVSKNPNFEDNFLSPDEGLAARVSGGASSRAAATEARIATYAIGGSAHDTEGETLKSAAGGRGSLLLSIRERGARATS